MNKLGTNSKQALNKTYSLSKLKSKKSTKINENLLENNEGNLVLNSRNNYDGLTDSEQNSETKFSVENENLTEYSSRINNNSDELSNISKNVDDTDSNSSSSYSSKESNYYESSESSDDTFEDSLNYKRTLSKFNLADLKPMETLSWLKNHGLNKMANLISRERNDLETKKIREETVLDLYNSDIKKFDPGYLKNLFILSLDKHINKNYLEEMNISLKNKEEKVPDIEEEVLEIDNNTNLNSLSSIENNSVNLKKKYIKPKLINRLEVSEEGISGENALAFQKYIRDLQEEVKMKDEKLRLREMERDSARLTRDQLTRAVKSSLEIGNGAGKLDIVIKEVIRRNLVYGFRLLQYNSRIQLKNRIGSEIFAGASLIKHLILKRLKFAFLRLNKNAIIKKDEIFWKKDIVNNEEVASNIISTFRNILPCYKLICIIQHNHVSALKKFLYIWSKCTNLKNNEFSEKNNIYYKRGNKTTLRELKIEAEARSKKFSNKEKRMLEKANKGFLSENSILGVKPSKYNSEKLDSKEMIRNIENKLGSVPNERLNYLTMFMNKNQEQRNIDIVRSIALNHLSEVIASGYETQESEKQDKNEILNKINEINDTCEQKLISSFENLIYNKDKFDILNEIKSHAKDKFKQSIAVPDWISEKHSKLLEDFYSNPFYSVFVNEYNKLIYLNNNSSNYQQSNVINYSNTNSDYTDSECEIVYYDSNYNLNKPQLNVEQLKNNVTIEPNLNSKLEVEKVDDLYICDDSQFFETVYYYDDNYMKNVDSNYEPIYEDQNIENSEYEQVFFDQEVYNQGLLNESSVYKRTDQDLTNKDFDQYLDKSIENGNLVNNNPLETFANEELVDKELMEKNSVNENSIIENFIDEGLKDEFIEEDVQNGNLYNEEPIFEEVIDTNLESEYMNSNFEEEYEKVEDSEVKYIEQL